MRQYREEDVPEQKDKHSTWDEPAARRNGKECAEAGRGVIFQKTIDTEPV